MAREYRLNARIATYSKPYLAIMQGITMGGAASVCRPHGSIRLVLPGHARRHAGKTANRPSFSDVGGHLPAVAPRPGRTRHARRAPPRAGSGPADAMLLGFADHMVTAGSLPDLRAALAHCRGLDAAISAIAPFNHPPPEGVLARQRDWIDRCYAHNSVEAILAALDDDGEPEAQEAACDIRRNSPTALKVTLNGLRAARSTPDLAGCLEREFRMMTAALRSHDLLEGIRARVIDKDGAPRWQPATLQDVRSEIVDAYFRDPLDESFVPPKDR